jgi:L-ribulose-5-phosphate 3-epimerase
VFSLGIVSDEIDRDAPSAFAFGRSLGITRYELRFLTSGRIPFVSQDELSGALEAARRYEVEITAISPGIYKYARTLSQAREEVAKTFAPSADLAHRLGLRSMIVFGPAKPLASDTDGPLHSSDDPPSWVDQALHELADAAAGYGLTVAIEPEPLSYTDTVAATAALLERVNRGELTVNYDPGNIAWAQGCDPADGVERLGPRIRNVHVKNLLDAPADRGPRWSAADMGLINYHREFAELKRIGYCGPVSLEPHMDGSPDSIRRALAGAQKAMSDGEATARS